MFANTKLVVFSLVFACASALPQAPPASTIGEVSSVPGTLETAPAASSTVASESVPVGSAAPTDSTLLTDTLGAGSATASAPTDSVPAGSVPLSDTVLSTDPATGAGTLPQSTSTTIAFSTAPPAPSGTIGLGAGSGSVSAPAASGSTGDLNAAVSLNGPSGTAAAVALLSVLAGAGLVL